jgi:hypothetical protein
MKFVDVNVAFRGVDLELLKRKILKQKNWLKRNRAKNRKNGPVSKKNYPVSVAINDEGED